MNPPDRVWDMRGTGVYPDDYKPELPIEVRKGLMPDSVWSLKDDEVLPTGCWYDNARGWDEIGMLVQEEAKLRGWKAEKLGADHEAFHEAITEAEEWLNDRVSPDGFYFGSLPDSGGDWGLYPDEEDDGSN